MPERIDPEAMAAASELDEKDLLNEVGRNIVARLITSAYKPRIAAYEARIKKLLATLESTRGLLVAGPIGPDFEADPDNGSPVDSVAHILGLCIQAIDEASIGDALDDDKDGSFDTVTNDLSPEDSMAHVLGLCALQIDAALIGDALDDPVPARRE